MEKCNSAASSFTLKPVVGGKIASLAKKTQAFIKKIWPRTW